MKPGWKLPEVPTLDHQVLAINLFNAIHGNHRWLHTGMASPHFTFFPFSIKFSAFMGWRYRGLCNLLFIFLLVAQMAARGEFFYGLAFVGPHPWCPTKIGWSRHKHPLEWLSIRSSGACLSILTGLEPWELVPYTHFAQPWVGFFYHTNIKTQSGWIHIFQRPEMHRIHHEYENTPTITRRYSLVGYAFWRHLSEPQRVQIDLWIWHEKELKLAEMLKFRDVHKGLKYYFKIINPNTL